ncbi:MAG: dihydroorotase family protein [Chloroflexi bacterium]|nr:dihydroorotase family protein [Chloroflexota bacterium]
MLVRIPGMVDPHTHLRDLDWSHKATFASETAAAVAGGYWAVFDMPNTPPTTISRAALDTKLAAISREAVCDWGVYAGASQADNTTEYATMASDVCGLKIFNNSTTGDLLLDDQSIRDRHYAAWPDSKIIAVHAEEDTVLDILALVRQYRKRTHFLHICTAREVGYLQAAKEEGLPVTVGVCPHHLYLTEDDERTLGAFGLMKPGLKTAADRDALWQAITSGVVDVVESDHAPHTREEKQSARPPYGVPGLETTLPLLLLAVSEGRLTLERVVELVATNPRRIWRLTCPPETYTLVDTNADYVIERDRLLTQCGWSPFEGMRVKGKVRETWIRGCKVYDGERVLVEPGFGRNLFGQSA